MADAAREPADILAFRKIIKEKHGGQHFYVRLLGLKTFETPDILQKVEAGFSYKTFEKLQRNLEFSIEELAKLVQIKQRTLTRRRNEGRLTVEESDRLLRASRVLGKILALFEGDVGAARTWLSKPVLALGNRTPLELSSTEVGANEVEKLIGRLEHGVFS